MVAFDRHFDQVMAFYSEMFKYYCLHFLILGRLSCLDYENTRGHIYLFSQIFIKTLPFRASLAELVIVKVVLSHVQVPRHQDLPVPKNI